jgi:sarcosine oxidase subunit gamma
MDVSAGGLRLCAADIGRVTWIAPYPGAELEVSHALKLALGLHFPAPGETEDYGLGRILWSGRAQALLLGARPPEALTAHAAVIDQTDAWEAMELTGAEASAVLARLTPLDLREGAFPAGRTARSLLGHMNAQITRIETGFELLMMRSMALTAAREVEAHMRSVAARAAL